MNFIELLENRDYKKLLQIPKSVIHSHAGRGGNIKFISERKGSCILPPPENKRNSISRLALSFSRLDVALVGGMEAFMKILEKFHQEYCPDTRFEPELTYGRNCNIDAELEYIDELLEADYFRSIDI